MAHLHLTRYSAFTLHLVLSVLIFSTLILTLYFFWFPGDLFFFDGGYQGLKLVAMVDLVLGPLLTLIIFKPGKKGLKFDLATIAIIQFAALGYGFYTTYHQQTIAVVFAEKTFNTLSRQAHLDANEQLLKHEISPNELSQFGSARPYTIYTVKPVGKSMGRFIADLLNGYPEAHERSDKYLNLAEHYEEMRENRLEQEKLVERGDWPVVNAALQKGNHSMDKVDLFNFKARYASGVAVFDPDSMRIVDYIKLKSLDRDGNEISSDTTQASAD